MAGPKDRKKAEAELERAGFKHLKGRGKGSHQVWHHEKSGVSTTVPEHGKEIPAGTWRSIEKAITAAQKLAAEKAAAEAKRVAGQGVAKAGGQSRGSDRQSQAASRHDSSKNRGRGRSR